MKILKGCEKMFELYNYNVPREVNWNEQAGENLEEVKKAILNILKEQKVSLSKTRYLFHYILDEIEDENPITL